MARELTPPADPPAPLTPPALEDEQDEQEETADDVPESERLPIGASIFTPSNPTTWRSTLSTIMSRAFSAGSSLGEELMTDPIGLAKRSSAALINALYEGTIQEVTGKPDGPDIKYPSANDASLKCERADDDKFNFNPDGKFTGALIVQRKDQYGNLDPNNVDTVIFENGKVIDIFPGDDRLGTCRIGNMQELQAQHVEHHALSGQGTGGRAQVAAQAAPEESRLGEIQATAARLRAILDRMRDPASGDTSRRAEAGELARQLQIAREENEAYRASVAAMVADIKRKYTPPADGPSPAPQAPSEIAAPAEQGADPGTVARDDAARAKAMEDVRRAIDSVAARLAPQAEGQPALTMKDLGKLIHDNSKNLHTIMSATMSLASERNMLQAQMEGTSDSKEKKELAESIDRKNQEISKWNALGKARRSQWDELMKLRTAAQKARAPEGGGPASEIIQAHSTTRTPPLTPRVQGGATDPGRERR